MISDEKQPFLSHLEELRKRIINCAIAVGICFVISYIFKESIFKILVDPLKAVMPDKNQLIYTGLTEMFFTYVKLAAVTGILIASPVIFYQMWMFVAPGLYRNERKLVVPFVLYSSILFISGALFGYFVVFPYGFKFLLGFENEFVRALPSVKEYFGLAIRLLFCFGLAFELPVVMFFLTKIGLVTPQLLKKYRKYAILLTFIIGAILTPPDPATQCMMAAPLILLYEIGIYVSKLAKQKKEEKEEVDE